jgi:hypothetical protein
MEITLPPLGAVFFKPQEKAVGGGSGAPKPAAAENAEKS